MLEGLKFEIYKANAELVKHELVRLKWGNISVRDADSGNVVIKPTNVAMEILKPDDMVVCDIDGKVLEGAGAPSSDLFTHLELYKAFDNVFSIVHPHSKWATVFAQAQMSVPNLGTTHADRFKADIPITRNLTPYEIKNDYYRNTGRVIVEAQHGEDPLLTPAALVRSHGAFVWGIDVRHAVENTEALEFVAEMAYYTMRISVDEGMNAFLLEEHTARKKHRE
ncbi:MAG: class II aldolase/adducin family protein [Christensenellaceae bacterium]|jgi:L-ribulose-5-phosphate 4-epimerase